ncbi:hypothetical protein NPIL_646201 [Nephila pilipes]|uniref:Uncharacterized protein n=1 Tax=Nephila pilipes TaxID=299642 RepID=A0A8X6P8L2_NEPPI|nr:hypothetical protein NPIL_646201 [Nephila pilipes]
MKEWTNLNIFIGCSSWSRKKGSDPAEDHVNPLFAYRKLKERYSANLMQQTIELLICFLLFHMDSCEFKIFLQCGGQLPCPHRDHSKRKAILRLSGQRKSQISSISAISNMLRRIEGQ